MYILAIDQGSSGSRAMLIDPHGRRAGYGYQAVRRIHPQPGWAEQDPRAVAASVRRAINAALAMAGCRAHDVVACGLTSQRDTVFAWDSRTGRPIGNAIHWQDLRTRPLVAECDAWEHAAERRTRLGQFPGPYCAAMHMAWRMRHDPEFRRAAEQGRLRVSLAAGWILHALGTPAGHALDVSLMQAMTVFDPRRRALWDEWIDYLGVPRAALPAPVPTTYPFGSLHIRDAFGQRADVPVLAMITDQQASLFGFDCRQPGEAACTHGTASFVHVVAGHVAPPQGTAKVYLAWELGGMPTYTLEADTTVTGAAIRWMQQLGLLHTAAELGPLAESVAGTGGVLFVPAFTGLGVPLEDRSARGTLLGMTLDTGRGQIARAFLESIGHQIADILDCFAREAGVQIRQLAVGGGIAASDAACQIQADLAGLPIIRPGETETTARAPALLAGLAAGVWPDVASLPALPGPHAVFTPRIDAGARTHARERWQIAVAHARGWDVERGAM